MGRCRTRPGWPGRLQLIRQGKLVHVEAPFLYLLPGAEAALLHDTGRPSDLSKDVVRRGNDALSYRYRGDTEEPEHYATWLAQLRERVPAGGTVLDLGCGCGVPLARDLAAAGYAVTGVDLSAVQVERARRLVPAVRFLQADATRVEFPPSSLDAVVSLYSLIHMPLDEQPPLLGRIGRWLRPGGWLLATTGQRAWTGTEDGWLAAERRCGGATPMRRPTGPGSSRPAWRWSRRRPFPRETAATPCSGLGRRLPAGRRPAEPPHVRHRPVPVGAAGRAGPGGSPLDSRP